MFQIPGFIRANALPMSGDSEPSCQVIQNKGDQSDDERKARKVCWKMMHASLRFASGRIVFGLLHLANPKKRNKMNGQSGCCEMQRWKINYSAPRDHLEFSRELPTRILGSCRENTS
jgi:hypothetical protein